MKAKYCKQCDRVVTPEMRSACPKCKGKESSCSTGCAVGCLAIILLVFLVVIIPLNLVAFGIWESSPSSSRRKSKPSPRVVESPRVPDKPRSKVDMGPLTSAGVAIRSVAREAITQRLKTPATADFPNDFEIKVAWQSSYIYKVSGYVDAENSLGANIREQWEVILLAYEKEEDQWSYQLRYGKLGSKVLIDNRNTPLPDHLAPPIRIETSRPSPSLDDQDQKVETNSTYIDAVADQLPSENKLGVTSSRLRSIENPEGTGAFVFVPEFRVKGTEYTRKVIWFVLDGKVYCLNGATKGSVTPRLPYPREDPEADWESTGHSMYGITSYGIKLAFE